MSVDAGLKLDVKRFVDELIHRHCVRMSSDPSGFRKELVAEVRLQFPKRVGRPHDESLTVAVGMAEAGASAADLARHLYPEAWQAADRNQRCLLSYRARKAVCDRRSRARTKIRKATGGVKGIQA